jgi:hypothetical protein
LSSLAARRCERDQPIPCTTHGKMGWAEVVPGLRILQLSLALRLACDPHAAPPHDSPSTPKELTYPMNSPFTAANCLSEQ